MHQQQHNSRQHVRSNAQQRGRTVGVPEPRNTVAGLHEGPGDEAGPLQAPGPIHVQLWVICWWLVSSLANWGLIMPAAGWRPPGPCSIGMHQEQREELQAIGTSSEC